ncbi:hypothetical protein [Bacillus thuringiensis]|uniref:hypothetical protein n=1 Tax=Bacillus thuringiensis TaxID=1428 RepID=UPI000A390766|nr:hypothetical protein [Bacillus thuringiensis]OUA60384.1 hypothetical protein BK785_09490 [Bacillus thuringiensis serovar bolivia]OUA80043.1 hypothetical protein BK787_03585 [Bacillus thuringiensis serovar pahangi]
MFSALFDNSEWCDVCGDVIPESDVTNMHIDGCEKTLCKSCRGEMETKLKVIDVNVLVDMLKALITKYGRDKVRQFDLIKAEQYVKENNITLKIEKRGGQFNQEKLGEFVSLSTKEILTIITLLQRKIGTHLWMNAVIGSVLERGFTATLQMQLEGERYDGTTDTVTR